MSGASVSPASASDGCAGAPCRIAVTAATLTGNHGAEAMLLATVGRLRERLPGAVFEVFSYYANEDRARVADPSIRFHSLRSGALVLRLLPMAALLALARRVGLGRAASVLPADVRALASCRVLVDLAGVSFADGRERFLAYNTLTLLPAFLLGVPVVKGSQALGPFRSALNRAVARRVLGRCHAVFARGERSHAHVRGLLGPGDRRGAPPTRPSSWRSAMPWGSPAPPPWRRPWRRSAGDGLRRAR